MKKINVALVQSTHEKFEIYHSLHPEVINSDYDGVHTTADFFGNFDYESLPADIRHIYIDIEMKLLPVGGIMVRSDFEIEKKEFSCDDIFTFPYIYKMVDLAAQECIATFKELCEQSKTAISFEIPMSEEVLSGISHEIIKHYFNFRKPFDTTNADLLNTVGLNCKPSGATCTVIQGTFLIIDELIYNNPHFDCKHNLSVFTKSIAEQRYNTIKMIAMEIVQHPVKLCLYDAFLFYKCVDCAMQILLSNKSDLLIPALDAVGMTKEIRDLFFKHGASFFNQLQNTNINLNKDETDLNKKHDWDKLFR